MNKLIVANWKMNGSVGQIESDLVAYANSEITNMPNVVLAVPSVYLYLASQIIKQLAARFTLAAQDISSYAGTGAYTGEISANMLKEFAIQYVIVGHSERRTMLNESDSLLLDKVENALACGLTPIYCIGEDKNLRDSGKYKEFLQRQMDLIIQVKSPISELVIAYEPIWSIGTGIIPTVEQIEDVLKLIHAFVQKNLPRAKITLLYGGSVSGKNVHEILKPAIVGGVLVGGASLKVDDFTKICTY